MIVRRLDDTNGTPRDVRQPTWRSRRLLLAGDGMGFSLHVTQLHAGTVTRMQYLHHLEAVYVLRGEGELVELETGERHRLGPGTMYALSDHDHHEVHAHTDVECVCVFNPPVVGTEVHDANGAYPLLASRTEEGV